MVDGSGGGAQQRISKPLMSITGLEAKSVHKAVSLQFIVHNTKGRCKMRITMVKHRPLCVYHLST